MRLFPFGKKYDGKKKDAPEQANVVVEKKSEEKQEKKAVVKSVNPKVKQDPNFISHEILFMPLVTEKGTILQSRNTYLFRVHKRATKSQVAYAIHQVYGVRPKKVRVVSQSSKTRRYGRATGTTSAWKKALVTLPTGQSIDTNVS